MTADAETKNVVNTERRMMKWLLGGQVAIALFLIFADAGAMLPKLFETSSDAPDLSRPTQPGDQTRRYTPSYPTRPGQNDDPDTPSRLTITTIGTDEVVLRGAIAPGDGVRIISELRRLAPDTVTLDSPGGSVADALDIGRLMRDQGVATQIGEDGICFSACPYIFVGGVARNVQGGGRLGVHQHSFGESTILPAFLATQDIQSGQAQVLKHLDDMGVDLRIMGPALATPASEIYILTATELSEWNVTTAP
ncbi:hypothetical protein N9L47_02115 [Rhodobacteraceae bacterium]|nr:hypothetical protein [Paracoccaceae bacterium]